MLINSFYLYERKISRKIKEATLFQMQLLHNPYLYAINLGNSSGDPT